MIEKKVVLITGGSDGIGRALCLEYASKGYAVVFSGRNANKIKEVQSELNQLNVPCLALQLDHSLKPDNEQFIANAMEKFGRIDVLINNAGVSMRVLFEELSLEIFDQIMQINFMAAVQLTHLVLPYLKATKGTLIGISSINGRRATPARTAYAASKYAMEGFFESLRMELMHAGVHVLVVCPGFTASSMRKSALMKDGKEQGETKLNESKMMSAATVASKVYRAMKRRKRDLILTTQGKAAVWANRFFPGIMDKIVFKVMAKKADSPFYKS